MIELTHLKIIRALKLHGTLTAAANALCLSQSALSHQIRYLEKKLELSLWQREGRNLRLTHAGEHLLQLAGQVMPAIEQTEQTLKAYAEGRQGILRIGVECYPCYRWLTGVIGQFLHELPQVDIDIVNKFQFSGLEGLLNHHIDILVTPDPIHRDGLEYVELAEYELVLLVSAQHTLAERAYVTPPLLADETLLTFPVPLQRLDIMSRFLQPAGIMPARHKEIESLEIMLQMTRLNRGICVVPDWLDDADPATNALRKIRLGRGGLSQKLYIARRIADRQIPYIERFIEVGQQIEYRQP
jgi:LysR family transcriptional regulator for metE and metH